MRVLALPKYGARAASTRQRFLQFVPGLRGEGIEVETRVLLDDRYLAQRFQRPMRTVAHVLRGYARRLRDALKARSFDLLWIHFELLPFFPVDAHHLIRLSGRPYVLDLDDANFHKYDLSRSFYVRRLLGRKFANLMARADGVITGSPYLEEYAKRFAPAVHRIPTVVDTDRIPYSPRGEAPVPVIGWIGSPSTTRYLQELRAPLAELARRRSFRFLTIGAAPLDWPEVPLDQQPWSEASEAKRLSEIDVGVMPLTDDPWSRGKCGYKLIQYMASGAPVVTSPVGANLEIVDAECGRFATDAQSWVHAMEELLAAPALRNQLGRHGRDRVVRHYSLVSQLPRLTSALRAAAGR